MSRYNLIRFDWAMKRLLRDKANFVVLEGFLSELLQDNIKIHRILESEGNKEDESDKFNRVDVLAENNKKELIIIEVQNTRELYYFQRMLYGVSKAITEYIHEGDLYAEVRKVYSINIVYFDLGQGSDYIYRGVTDFRGIHSGDTLRLSTKQRNTFVKENAGEIFPEYYVLRVNEFDDRAKTPLDEWVRFLKSGII
ncbi:MAG: Rpn family recombination-promoting nuclease/putative transposase, partial [Butyricimonas paravirosa]